MANAPLATDLDATIWTTPGAIPYGATVETTNISSTAGVRFSPATNDTAFVKVYNAHASQTLNVGVATATSSSISAYTTLFKLTTGQTGEYTIPFGMAMCLTASGTATAHSIFYMNCTKGSAT